jgi:hypothetical protein
VDKWIEATASGRYDAAFVANTDMRERPGSHWALFYLPADRSRRPFFFDSFARHPKGMKRPLWANYLATASKRRGGDGKWDDAPVSMQDPSSTVCGQLCAMALCRLAHGKPLPISRVSHHHIVSFMNKMKT